MSGRDPQAVPRVAGLFSQLRSENELVRREMRLRRRLYASRIAQALPNPLPGWRAGVLSTSELATLWQLPRARVKHARLPRDTVRRAIAPPEIAREQARMLLRDERGPVSIAAADRKYGHALIGGQGGGKSSVLARHFANDARDLDRAVVLIDPKGPLGELCLGLVPSQRTVHYLDLGHPEIGINPLTINASPGARAAVFLHALIEANPPGAIQAASDSFLRQAVAAVCAVERTPTLWHVYRLLESGHSPYRESVARRLAEIPGNDFARHYWRREFPALIADRGFAATALNPPRNKLERLISTREIDTLLRHPITLDFEGILERGEVLILTGAKATFGEDNTVLVSQLLLQLLHRALQARHHQPDEQPRRVSLLIDEAHNVLTPSVAKMLAEGRSAGLEAVFAWQYSAQIRDEVIRSGVRSLLQSISIRARWMGSVRPDAMLDVGGERDEAGRRLFLVEYDRTRRVDKNYDKFRRYDTFLCWWWRHAPVADSDQPPFVLFICQDESQRSQFLDAADRELTGHRWHPGAPPERHDHVGRRRILFALERDAHDGAWRLPSFPRGHPARTAEVRRVALAPPRGEAFQDPAPPPTRGDEREIQALTTVNRAARA